MALTPYSLNGSSAGESKTCWCITMRSRPSGTRLQGCGQRTSTTCNDSLMHTYSNSTRSTERRLEQSPTSRHWRTGTQRGGAHTRGSCKPCLRIGRTWTRSSSFRIRRSRRRIMQLNGYRTPSSLGVPTLGTKWWVRYILKKKEPRSNGRSALLYLEIRLESRNSSSSTESQDLVSPQS